MKSDRDARDNSGKDLFMDQRMRLEAGDITKLEVDAIVNAANQSLLGGGGVDGAIHRAAGHDLLRECETLGGARTGDAKITFGYDLPARYVIHAVGPVYKSAGAKAPGLLASCYRRSMELAKEHGIESIAFPAISCGIYGYPIDEAAEIAVRTVAEMLKEDDNMREVIFCAFDENIAAAYREALAG